jgi:hypothetical protein
MMIQTLQPGKVVRDGRCVGHGQPRARGLGDARFVARCGHDCCRAAMAPEELAQTHCAESRRAQQHQPGAGFIAGQIDWHCLGQPQE